MNENFLSQNSSKDFGLIEYDNGREIFYSLCSNQKSIFKEVLPICVLATHYITSGRINLPILLSKKDKSVKSGFLYDDIIDKKSADECVAYAFRNSMVVERWLDHELAG